MPMPPGVDGGSPEHIYVDANTGIEAVTFDPDAITLQEYMDQADSGEPGQVLYEPSVDPPVTLAESAAEFVGGKDDTELHRNLGKSLIELLMERGGLTLAA